MKNSTWKQIERDWADRLGGKRIPITGRVTGDVPDVKHHLYAIEVKAGKVISARLRKGFGQAELAAKSHLDETGATLLPIVCITQSEGLGHPNSHYVAMSWETFELLHLYFQEVDFDPDEFRNYLEGNKKIDQARFDFDSAETGGN